MANSPKKGRPLMAIADERTFHVSFDLEEDGRIIAEIEDLPGVMAYGVDQEDALRKVTALAFRVVADQIEMEEAARPAALRIVA
jgi:predicted RNase H-like HicB family nuclease